MTSRPESPPANRRVASLPPLALGGGALRRFPLWLLPLLPGAGLYLAAYLPALLSLIALSFQTYVPGQWPAPILTLANYVRFLADPYYLKVLLTSCYLAALASVVTVTIAYPLAYALVRSAGLRRVILPVVGLSFFVSAIVLLYGLMQILGRSGSLNGVLLFLRITSEPIPFLYSDTAVLVGLADFAVPYAVLILASSINNVDPSLEQASENLGATKWQTLFRITVPLTFPGILAALVLAFALSVSAVLTPLLLGGGRVLTLATQVYDSMLVTLNYPFASASATIILVAVFVLTYSTGRALRTRVV